MSPGRPWRERLTAWAPILLLAPSLGASLIYVFGFTLWTCWISVSSSTLLPPETASAGNVTEA